MKKNEFCVDLLWMLVYTINDITYVNFRYQVKLISIYYKNTTVKIGGSK